MAEKLNITFEEIQTAADNVCELIYRHCSMSICSKIYGVPRGGVSAAMAVINASHLIDDFPKLYLVDTPQEANIFIDDLIDSGATRDKYQSQFINIPFYALFDKQNDRTIKDNWLIFPWEMADEANGPEDNIVRLLEYVGEGTAREGLKETPARVLKAWDHWTSGYDKDPKDILKVFEDGAKEYDEMVIVKDIPLYSKCEHHMADIFGTATIAYIPDGRIVGLSKLSRLVDMFARRLQVQERLTAQIAEALNEHLCPKGVGVVIKARHMCMESRGICQQGHHTITSALKGAIKTDERARAEFLALAQ